MKKIDLHIHTNRSHHGSGDLIDYIERAIELRYSVIGFNEHAPYLFDHDHRLSVNEMDKYINDALLLKSSYRDQIEILVGLEVDYHPVNHEYISNLIEDLALDFCSGAIHFLTHDSRFPSVWDFELFHDSWFIEQYFELLESAAKSKLFSHIVHPDIILRSGIDADSLEERFEKLFKIMRANNVAYEINCSGVKKKTFEPQKSVMNDKFGSYPCIKYIKMATDFNVPLAVGSDAHSVDLLDANIPLIVNQLSDASILSMCNFMNGLSS